MSASYVRPPPPPSVTARALIKWPLVRNTQVLLGHGQNQGGDRRHRGRQSRDGAEVRDAFSCGRDEFCIGTGRPGPIIAVVSPRLS